MKRLHIHIAVEDLQQSIDFYQAMLGEPPTRVEEGYAKWMTEEPRLNFAITSRGGEKGLRHLGFQFDSVAELDQLRARFPKEDAYDEGATTCCYARSEKSWIKDPAGIAWENFYTSENLPVFSEAVDLPETSIPDPSSCCS